ncbi:Translation elongation factor G-related protein [Collimonas arenae]|uniref:Elongation factor G n=1 Tax=Collimonas arenae TaxID=279058 RepID=A0A0A1FDT0_9BURK|nr:elongation factor G [Collimonas arenae]AIY41955.1 Translation elongation factor G-related protein [Collimonas arenae]
MTATTTLRANSRNFGIIAHIDAGKTTLSERILLKTGEIHRAGEVHDGAATMDHMDLEKERGITIGAAATRAVWNGHTFTLIDTPGHIDFAIEVERSLRVLDGAIAVLSGVEGIQPQTETVWRQAQKHAVPMIVFVNKMDRVGADFERVVGQMRDRLDALPVPLTIPVGAADTFAGAIDVLGQRLLSWDASGLMTSSALPQNLAAIALDAYAHAAAVAADASDALTSAYLDNDTLSAIEIATGLRAMTIARRAVPVFAGSAYKNAGIEPLLDAIVDWLPSPEERAAPTGLLAGASVSVGTSPSDPLAALVFKVIHDDHGSLSFVRLYGGTLREGDTVWNATLGAPVRIGRLYVVHADRRVGVEEASAGSIIAIAGLKDALTGQTLSTKAVPLTLETIQAGEPVVALAVEPANGGDRSKMIVALDRFRREDPSLRLESNPETGETVLWGQGELHLDVVLERVRREAGVDVKAGAPHVAYKETIDGPAVQVEGKVSKQNGGKGQYARVVLRVEPFDGAFAFENAVKGGAIPSAFFPAVEKGVRQALAQGPLGQPVTGVKVTLLDGDHHAVDSSDMTFTVAAKDGVLAGLKRAHPVLLEPVMTVTVDAPTANAGDVIGDLQRRSGRVLGIEDHAGRVEIVGEVPLARLFGHTTDLRSLSQGRAFASAVYARHAASASSHTEAIAA